MNSAIRSLHGAQQGWLILASWCLRAQLGRHEWLGWLNGEWNHLEASLLPLLGAWIEMTWRLDSIGTLWTEVPTCVFSMWLGLPTIWFHYTLKCVLVLSKTELPSDQKSFHKFSVPKSLRPLFKKLWLLLFESQIGCISHYLAYSRL